MPANSSGSGGRQQGRFRKRPVAGRLPNSDRPPRVSKKIHPVGLEPTTFGSVVIRRCSVGVEPAFAWRFLPVCGKCEWGDSSR